MQTRTPGLSLAFSFCLALKHAPMDGQLITGISTAVIALCALGVSIWQVRKGIYYNRLSLRPHLTTWTDMDPHHGFYDFI
jgi:hypothetical protein